MRTLELLGLNQADGHVVKNEERLRADAGQVVHQHRHQIDAHRVVTLGESRDLELGPHPVGRRDQHGLVVLEGVEGEEPAESADAAEHAGAKGALHARLDARDDVVTGFDRNSCARVGSRAGDLEQSTHQRLPTAPMVTGIGAGYEPVRQASQHSPSSWMAARKFGSVMYSSESEPMNAFISSMELLAASSSSRFGVSMP